MASRASGAVRLRPAARRRPGVRQGASRIRWDKLGRTALVCVIAAVLFSYFSPGIDFVRSYRETTIAKAELRDLQQENRTLHNLVQSADKTSVLEREARRQGMVAAGERSYVIRGLGD